MKKTLLIDCDGILADFITPALKLVADITGKRYQHDDITTWEIFESLPEVQHAKDEIYAHMKWKGYCAAIPPYAGAQDGLRRIRELVDVVCVTSPFSGSPTWHSEREQWLQQHFDIHHHDVIHASKKFRVIGDFFLDDKPEHVEKWAEAHMNFDRTAFLWCMKYNANFTWSYRIRSWDALYNAINIRLVPEPYSTPADD